MQTIKTLEPWRDVVFALPRLSRDGRWIAYSTVERQGSSGRGLHVIHRRAAPSDRLEDVRGSSASPVWSPDGSHLVFVNQQSGSATMDLMAVNVNAPTAPPVRLHTASEASRHHHEHRHALLDAVRLGMEGLCVAALALDGQVVEQFRATGSPG